MRCPAASGQKACPRGRRHQDCRLSPRAIAPPDPEQHTEHKPPPLLTDHSGPCDHTSRLERIGCAAVTTGGCARGRTQRAELPEGGLRVATVEDVRDALTSMSTGLSEASARQYVLRIKSLLGYAHALGYTPGVISRDLYFTPLKSPDCIPSRRLFCCQFPASLRIVPLPTTYTMFLAKDCLP
jgi:hypothetical protein